MGSLTISQSSFNGRMKNYNLKMYLVVVLLLLFETTLINTMEPSGKQEIEIPEEDEMVPLIDTSSNVKLVIKYMTRKFRIPVKEKIIRLVSCTISRLQGRTNEDYCERDQNSSTSEYYVTKDGLTECLNTCTRRNQNHVQTLNSSILLLIEQLFGNTLYRLQLTAVNENIGECVPNNNKFLCECKFNYQILVNFQLLFLWDMVVQDKILLDIYNKPVVVLSEQQKYLVTFIGILKNYPVSAESYLKWLLRNIRRSEESPQIISYDLNYSGQSSSSSSKPQHFQLKTKYTGKVIAGDEGNVNDLGVLKGGEDRIVADCMELFSFGFFDGFNRDPQTICNDFTLCVWNYKKDAQNRARHIRSTRRV